jgi:signal transduction histidine kinase
MALVQKLDLQAVLDGLGHGVLIFDSNGRLTLDNLTSRTLLGTDLSLIRSEGWKAATVLFDAGLIAPDSALETMRKKALESERPVRFQILRSGEYVPCWAAAVHGEAGAVYTMITLDMQDWTAMEQIMNRFSAEMLDAVSSTQGHIDLITQTLKNYDPEGSVKDLSRRITGFTRLISTHMHRGKRLLEMFDRFEDIRTGALQDKTRDQRRQIKLADFLEDFVEELDEIILVDPETEAQDHRARVTTKIPSDLTVLASSQYLNRILRELLRNAIMYSLRATPIKIEAHVVPAKQSVQIDMIDEGYGVRTKEAERVFTPFQRARQPQVIAEFGYGLSLYLCKHEVEAMSGQMWFKSDEGVGTTFSFTLPVWRDESAPASSSSTSTSESASVSSSSADSSSAGSGEASSSVASSNSADSSAASASSSSSSSDKKAD